MVVDFHRLRADGPPLFIRDQLVENVGSFLPL